MRKGLWLVTSGWWLCACASSPPPDPEQVQELEQRIAELRARIEGHDEAWRLLTGVRGRVVEVHRDLVRLAAGGMHVGEHVVLRRDGERVAGAEVYYVGGGAAWAVADEGAARPGDLVYARRP